jgi:hypothetical protein
LREKTGMELPKGGIWYEPRSLWSIANVSTANTGFRAFENMEPEHFRNGTRWPIVIDRVAFCGVNYPFDRPDTAFAAPSDAAQSAVVNKCGALVSAPFRQHYSKNQGTLAAYRPSPTGEPASVNALDGPLFGVTRLDFAKPLLMPQFGTLEMRLSSVFDFAFGGVDVLSNAGVTSLPASIVWQERGYTRSFPGNGRTFDFELPVAAQPNMPAPGYEGWPYPLTPGIADALVDNGVRFWSPNAIFDAQRFNAQESSRSGSNYFQSVAVALDQLDYDAALQAAPFNGDGKVAPVSMRVGCAARSVNGGSTDDWWRPGAPLALVLDTITPAVVYRLPQPITLSPGDVLDVEVAAPGLTFATAESYQIGVSFNGYAPIEG